MQNEEVLLLPYHRYMNEIPVLRLHVLLPRRQYHLLPDISLLLLHSASYLSLLTGTFSHIYPEKSQSAVDFSQYLLWCKRQSQYYPFHCGGTGTSQLYLYLPTYLPQKSSDHFYRYDIPASPGSFHLSPLSVLHGQTEYPPFSFP